MVDGGGSVMADLTKNWGQITSGSIDLKLVDNGDTSYSIGMTNTGAGVGDVTAYWDQITSGQYPLKMVDNLDGSYSIGISNG